MTRRAWISAGLVWGLALLSSGCPSSSVPTGSPVLSLRTNLTQIDDQGQTATLTVTTLTETGDPGTGDVSLTATAGTLDPSTISLSSAGRGTASYACTVADDSRCVGGQTLTAQWQGIQRTVTIKVAGAPDAGTWFPSADAGCIGVISPDGSLYECPNADGGACTYKYHLDGGVTQRCDGAEGAPCLTPAACQVGSCTTMFPVIQGQIGHCTIWYCAQPTGPCGDGGYCIQLSPYNLYCSTGAAGSPCTASTDCLDGGACLTVAGPNGIGQKCSYGQPGDPCNDPTDCLSGAAYCRSRVIVIVSERRANVIGGDGCAS